MLEYMNMAEEHRINVDIAKVRKAVQSSIPLSITTYTLPRNMVVYMTEVLSTFLTELNQPLMVEFLSYSINELVTNAKKANTKRVYFAEKGLDIKNPSDYATGMENFKEDTLNNINHYLELQKNKGLYVKLIMQAKNDKIKIEVKNNSELTEFEYRRIHDKIARAQQYTSAEEAFAKILDDTEGAGLGLIIMILMLQKIGLTEENFQVLCENGETINRIILPINQSQKETTSELSKQLVDLVDSLPQFSDNIMHINSMLNDEKVSLNDVAAEVNKDVALTADLLKLANSPAFSTVSRFHNVRDAIVHIGIREVKNLLMSVGALNSLKSVSNEQRTLWEHSYQVAIYSYNLAKHYYKTDKTVIQDSYICGLLHDMGKMAYNSAFPQLKDNYFNLLKPKGLTSDSFEKITSGLNHAEIGALIAEKWNLPSVISSTIRYHHTPDLAPTDVKKLATVVYFSNMICNYKNKEVEYYQFDQAILEGYNITSEEHLNLLIEKFEEHFAQNN